MSTNLSSSRLRKWFRNKPDLWVQVLTVRASIRAAPIFVNQSHPLSEEQLILALRPLIVSWAACNTQSVLGPSAAARAAAAANTLRLANYPEFISATASSIADPNFSAHATSAVLSAQQAANSMGYDLWDSILADESYLFRQDNISRAAELLLMEKLWLDGEPSQYLVKWARFAEISKNLDHTFSVWFDWLGGRLRGDGSAFDVSGDYARVEDRKILLEILRAGDRSFWSKGYLFINNNLEKWIEEANSRTSSKSTEAPTYLEFIGNRLLESAGPQARIVNGKLDAVPNALFDSPQYGDNLADLPSEMQAFLAVLEQSLPRNCPIIVRNCIKGYSDELLVRGNRPIVNILTGMASAIAAQFWIVGEGDGQHNPETWQVRHPEEWDNGTVELLRTFFKKHIDLITHFPLNVEREELIANTPIDEIKASGPTLLDPIQAVNDLIIGLNKDGLATDNILRIMDAHLRYARDISGLPAPDRAITATTSVTPKRRFVLNSAGFYLHAYSILGTTVSLAESKQIAALMVQLYAAAQVLLGFIL